MRVILTSDVKKHGKKGDILNVKDGYGSFLIKNNLAVLETSTSKRILDEENREKKEKEDEIYNKAMDLKKSIEKVSLSFKLKVSDEGKVFGSISSKQISNGLKDLGFDIDRRKIVIDSPINALGDYYVYILLHKRVKAKIKIHVLGE